MKWQFGVSYSMLVIAFLASLIVTVAVARGQIPGLPHHTGPVVKACSSVSCAKIGDSVTYELAGRVTAIDGSQPHVICLSIVASNNKRGGSYCEVTP